MQPLKTQNGGRASRPADRIDLTDSLPESRQDRARQYGREGDRATGAGDMAAAETAYRASLVEDGTGIRARHNLGVVYYRQQKWEDALACFERCVQLDRENADLRFRSGLCLLRTGRTDEARRAFEAALERDPDHLEARFQLALHHTRGSAPGSRGRRQAVETLKTILDAADRGVPCPNLDRVCFLLASFLDDLPEHTEEAIAVYRRGLEQDPLFAPGHNNLGVLLMQAGQTIPALGAFKIAIHLEPDYTLPYRNLARLLFDRLSPAQMEREYTSIIEEFGVRSASVLARLSLELIDLGRAQVSESLYTHGHQIKNRIGVVGSRTRRLLRNMPPDAAGLDGLKEIAREQERIYDQWVAYLRSMKQDALNPALVEIPPLVRKALDALSDRKGGKTVEFTAEPRIPQVKVDPGMICEAVSNLVLNALEAVGETGSVAVQAGYDARRASVYIEVEDNGPGIPVALQSRIFDPGYSTKEKGNGYGLSICARIASAHRGSLRLVSRPGEGTVFRIDLPIDFELTSEEDAISLQQTPAPRHPLSDELID